MTERRAGGPLVKSWTGYFLRDDAEIRQTADIKPYEAYSLFEEDPYGRLAVYAGPREWAIKQAEELLLKLKEETGT